MDEPISKKANNVELYIDKSWGRMQLGKLRKSYHIDIFMRLLKEYSDTGELIGEISYSDINNYLSANKNNPQKHEAHYVSSSDMAKFVTQTKSILTDMIAEYYDENGFHSVVLFTRFDQDIKNKVLRFKWNPEPEILALLHSFNENIEHSIIKKDFFLLNGKYSKMIYIMLKEFDNNRTYNYKNIGKCIFSLSVDDWCDKLCLSASYRKDISNLKRRIFTPALKELSGCFDELALKTVCEQSSTHSISDIAFTWNPRENKKIKKFHRN